MLTETDMLEKIKNGMNTYQIAQACNIHWITADKNLSILERKNLVLKLENRKQKIYFPTKIGKTICKIENDIKLEELTNRFDDNLIKLTKGEFSIIFRKEELDKLINVYSNNPENTNN